MGRVESDPSVQLGAQKQVPRVSIGLPVYNGENFIEAAIDSILAQTYRDFELIISDNASTDRTEVICRDYEARDPRVKYLRQPENLGAAPNYNFVFHKGRGEYFKWAAHDDVVHPRFLEEAVSYLDGHSEVGLVFSKARRIDGRGSVLGTYDQYYQQMRMGSEDPVTRFGDMICHQHNSFALFGLMRREVMATTQLHGAYAGGDRTLLSEMALRARLHQLPDYLFDRRDHPEAYSSQKTARNRMAWWDISKGQAITFPGWRNLKEYFQAIQNADLVLQERLRSYGQLGRWLIGPRWYRQRWLRLLGDLIVGVWYWIRRLGSTPQRALSDIESLSKSA